jgi:protocatechuate 3,4-dioxygenase beta subunit
MPSYNGHKNYNHWNVSLWLNNDEGLYRQAKQCIKATRTRDAAARMMLEFLNAYGVTHTEDNVRYTVTTISAALRDM